MMKKTNVYAIGVALFGLQVLSGYSQSVITFNTQPAIAEYAAHDKIICSPGSKFVASTTARTRLFLDYIPPVITAAYSSSGTNGTNPVTHGLDLSRPVGSVPYTYNVSPVGSASCDVPVYAPKGTQSMEPSISLSYSSLSTTSGLLGCGWDISGISGISRSPQTIYHNGSVKAVDLSNNDVFNLDGNRLIPVSGANGNTNTVYATESETFSRITSYNAVGNGPEWFKVETKDGITIEYGKTADARLIPVGQSTAIDWKVSKMYDAHGNYILFNYYNQNGECYIKEILYTGNSSAGIQPYNSIEFKYDSKQEQNSAYVNGGELNQAALLNSIKVKAEGQLTKEYNFKYAYYHVNSYLIEIEEKGSNNSAINPLKFSYGQDDAPSSAAQNITKTSTNSSSYKSEHLLLDFDADGKKDLISFNYDIIPYQQGTSLTWFNWECFRNVGNSTFQSTSPQNAFPQNFQRFDSYPASKSVAGNMIYEAIDFNGDSKEDMLFLTVVNASSTTKTLTFYQYISNGTNMVASGSPITVTVNNDYKYWYADVNGDRKMDLMVYSRSTAPASDLYVYYNSSPSNFIHTSYTGVSSPWLQSSMVVDIDGDGISEFANVTYPTGGPAGKYLLKFINGVPTFVQDNSGTSYINLNYYVGNSIYMDNPFFLYGDFNGDGKSDYFSHYQSSASIANWYIGLGTGDGTFKKFLVNSLGFPTSTNNKFYLTHDVNGDGKTDVLEFSINSSNRVANNVNVYYSTGHTFVAESFTMDMSSYSNKLEDLNFGDFNGDGTDDLLIGGDGSFNPTKIFYFNRGAKANYLEEIYDGMDKSVQFVFSPLTQGSPFFTKTTAFTYPLSDFQQAFYTVKEVNSSNGIGGLNTMKYSYEDAVINKQGKGLIGFKKMTSTDVAGDVKTITSYGFDPTFFNLLPLSALSYEDSNSNPLSSITYQSTTTSLNSGKSYFHKIDNVTAVNHVAGFTKTTDYIYDAYGNVTSETTDVNTGAEITTVTNVYTQAGAWIPSKLDNTQTSNTRLGETAYSRKMNFTYNALGDVINKTSDLGTSGAISIDFVNNPHTGATLQTTMSSGALLPKVTSNVYDAKFRHIIKNYNVLNQLTEYTYDLKWSKPLTVKGIDGLITTFQYDAFGKDIYKKTPDNNEVQTTYDWVQPGDIAGNEPVSLATALYKTITTETAKPYAKNMYDMFGRIVKKETEGFSNNLFAVYSYDARGRKFKESSVYQTSIGNTYLPLLSTYSYNNHNLPEQINTTDGTIHQNTLRSYTYNSGNTTVTETSPDNKISTTTIDATGVTIAASDAGGNLAYEYYSNKKPKSVTLNGTQMNYMEYDALGNQSKLIDKDAGTILYTYNAYNLLISKTDAKGQVFQYDYDVFNRITTKTTSLGAYTYLYIPSGNGINQLSQITAPNGITESHSYDNLNRPVQFTETVNGNTFTTAYDYDQYSNVIKVTYPSGFAIKKQYNNKGFLTTIKRNDNSALIWQQDEVNPMGQETKFTLGNQVQSVHTYNNFGNLVSMYANGIQDVSYQFDVLNSNLNYRTDNSKSLTENFLYDNLNRLTQSLVAGTSSPIDVSYNTSGNITQKTETGSTSFHSSKINATETADNPNGDISIEQQDISYTPFNKAQTIIEGDYQYELMYGCNEHRKKTQLFYQSNLVSTKFYSTNYEKQITTANTTEIHYINGLNGLCAMYVINNGVGTMYYAYTDHLGSINTVADQSGTIVAEQNFDAWGRKRNPADWSYAITGTVPAWLQRGFTGHEHLPEFSLINMNGRLYDPILSSMLSPDKYNQSPNFTQNYNRYGYAYNNPLKFTDPSGDFILRWLMGFTKGIFQGKNAIEAMERGDREVRNDLKIVGGLFASDKSNNGNGKRFLEVMSRLTYQAPQTKLGLGYNLLVSAFGNVDNVEYYHGATVVYGSATKGGGMTLGSYISLPGNGDGYEIGMGYDSRTLMHEYGHYLQSRDVGGFYLFKYAIPSLGPLGYVGWQRYEGAYWTELDANSRSAKYFSEQTKGNFDWQRDITEAYASRNKGTLNLYVRLPQEKNKLAWYFLKEFL